MTFEPTAVIRAESKRIADVLIDLDRGTPVPTCPGWSASHLLWHVTATQLFWGSVIASGSTTEEQVQEIESHLPVQPTARAEILLRRERATEDLLAALLTGPLDAPSWTWFGPDQSVGFSQRMQTHETTIHRVDAELTAGLPVSSIQQDVAAAGIDHVIDVMWNWIPDEADRTQLGIVELRPSDAAPRLVELVRWTGRRWGRGFTDQIGAVRAPADAQPTAVVEASAHELDLLVWSRPARVAKSGEIQLLAAFDELIEFGIQ